MNVQSFFLFFHTKDRQGCPEFFAFLLYRRWAGMSRGFLVLLSIVGFLSIFQFCINSWAAIAADYG
jgi:hypothetical protein